MNTIGQTFISPYVYAGLAKPRTEIDNDAIMLKVCKHFDISVEQLRSKTRDRVLVQARSYYIHILYEFMHFTLKRIAESINRDHSSIIHLRDKFKSDLEIYQDVRLPYRKFVETVNYQWSYQL